MSGGSSAEAAAAPERAGATLVVGLGNPLLADDGVGWRVAELVRERLAGDPALVDVEVDQLAVGGLSLMERLVGYRRAILVDAMLTGEHAAGTVRRFSLADLPGREATHLDSAHDASLAIALAAGRSLGADLPAEIAIVAVEAVRVDVFGEEMTPAVAAAIPDAVEAVLAEIGETGG
jgi:hydrogenase maturation protease